MEYPDQIRAYTRKMEQSVEVQTCTDPQNGENRDSHDCITEHNGPILPNGQCSKTDCKKHGKDDNVRLTNGENEKAACSSTPHIDASLPKPEVSNPVGIETFDGNVQYQFGEPPPCECDECILENGDEIKPPVKKFNRVSPAGSNHVH